MSRTYKRRYKILTGDLVGQSYDGFQIGTQDFPNQYQEMEHSQLLAHRRSVTESGRSDGIWLIDLNRAIYRVHPIQGEPTYLISDEGAKYGNDYVDLVIPFDRNGNEIKVGDEIYVAVKNEVRKGMVVKIATKPFVFAYGIVHRKLTVYVADEDRNLTINDPTSTIKA